MVLGALLALEALTTLPTFPHLVNENIENLLPVQVYLDIVEMWISDIFGCKVKMVQG